MQSNTEKTSGEKKTLFRGEKNGKSEKTKGYFNRLYSRLSLKTAISVIFTATAVFAIAIMGISFYVRFQAALRENTQEEYIRMTARIESDVTDKLRAYMQIADSLTYNVIKNSDFETDSVWNEFNLICQTNSSDLLSVALFDMQGNVIEAAPAALCKQNTVIRGQSWFEAAVEQPENTHFSMPHIENVFVNGDGRYDRVITISKTVDINYAKHQTQGVLMLDIKYSAIEELLSGANIGDAGYTYIESNDGEIIYHPQLQLIWSGEKTAPVYSAKEYPDGTYTVKIDGEKYVSVIKTIGYTGWRIVGEAPYNSFNFTNLKSGLFLLWLAVLFTGILIIVNAYMSQKVSNPIAQLEQAVEQIAMGNLDVEIPSGGSFEVWHLQNEIRRMVQQLKKLMDSIVLQQQIMRKSELDVLQSQINPHFLYNTLDIIVWFIENGQYDEAVTAVTALARFFRISLSKGKNVITVADEIEHVRNYLLIQEMRYKNKFSYSIELSPEIAECETVKLILQPIVENAIYHGMEFMDGDGKIDITAKPDGEDIVFTVADNGPGMPPEKLEKLIGGEVEPSRRGSGIGVRNVQQRLRLTYGEGYGLKIESEPDEGTTVYLRIKRTVGAGVGETAGV